MGQQVVSAPVERVKPVLTRQTFGGPLTTLRAYQHWHPYAAIYTVTYRGRTVWMTSRQQAIWHEIQKYWKRGKRDTLQRIATIANCSKATVSRFLRRLDLWRFIDLATLRGKGGGTYIFTRRDPYNEKPRRWTMKAREAIRNLRAAYIRHAMHAQLQPLLLAYREAHPPRPKGGSTGATYEQPTMLY